MAETIKLVQLLKMCTTLWYSTLFPFPPCCITFPLRSSFFFFSLFNADNRDEGEKRQRIACKTRPRIVDKRQRQTAFLWLRLNNKTINFHYRLAAINSFRWPRQCSARSSWQSCKYNCWYTFKVHRAPKKKNANKKILVECPTFESPQRFQFVCFLLFTTTFT